MPTERCYIAEGHRGVHLFGRESLLYAKIVCCPGNPSALAPEQRTHFALSNVMLAGVCLLCTLVITWQVWPDMWVGQGLGGRVRHIV